MKTSLRLKLQNKLAGFNRNCHTKRKKWYYTACRAHATACRGPSGTGPSSAIMAADAVTTVTSQVYVGSHHRAGDTITCIDHFGGDSEGPGSTAILF